MRATLGDDVKLFDTNCIISCPGATEQRIHVDAPHLFDPKTVGCFLPAHHYSCFIPLVSQTQATGNTAFVLGSHATHRGGYESHGQAFPGNSEFVDVYAQAGSVVIFDCRIYHRGRANLGEAIRPLFGLMFSKP